MKRYGAPLRASFQDVAAGLLALATLGFVAAVLTGKPEQWEPPSRPEPEGTRLVADARPKETRTPAIAKSEREKRPELRYVVKRGDTLWAIAARHYRDAERAMRTIKRRNGLERETVFAGEVLVLPPDGRG